MSSKRSADKHQLAVNRFWHNYLSILDKSTIPSKSKTWYRKHAEAYIAANRDTPLVSHTHVDVDRYLNAKGRLPGLPEWQFRQVADALRMAAKAQ